MNEFSKLDPPESIGKKDRSPNGGLLTPPPFIYVLVAAPRIGFFYCDGTKTGIAKYQDASGAWIQLKMTFDGLKSGYFYFDEERTFLMTWTDQKRWMKKYQGTNYSRSCKQLGCPETKEDSYHMANAWWEWKEAELNGKMNRPAPKLHELPEQARAKTWIFGTTPTKDLYPVSFYNGLDLDTTWSKWFSAYKMDL